ncbi:MAG: hypothetical protein A4S16_08520 [Proteobacteria bacterium SG_bin6]|nr:MAG: hypothetical protein A4S16_08520 [Proteobacteria bacterium SG_bin6]
MHGERLIDVKELAKSFGELQVVECVSLTLDPGGILGLLGAPGSGKTTTLRMIAGLLRPDAGCGQVLGEDVGSTSALRRSRIGYMGNRLGLSPDLTVLEVLSQSAEEHGMAAAHRAIAAAVERYALRSILDKRCGELSGDWARRVQFVATILHRPALLLLDEPTTGFDAALRDDLWSWIERLAAEGHGIVVTTNDIAEAERCQTMVPYRDRRALPQRPSCRLRNGVGTDRLVGELAPCSQD